MKILYISGGSGQDYLRDACFHGLRSLLGPDVVDVGKLDSLYLGADRSQMYGKGFTLYAELPDLPVDRTDIPQKISCKYFDVIIYGSIHRCQDFLYEVASKYRAPACIFIDGEDHPGYLSGLQGLTFKRELYNPHPGALPIHFGIPASKILKDAPKKSNLMAPCDPINRKTYLYSTEEAYYAQYASAYYAATMKKAGWDCLRHYEIMANWTLPYFRVLDQLPPLICHNLPRQELLLAKAAWEYYKDRDSSDVLLSLYWDLIDPVMQVLRTKLTTEAVATYILDTIGIATKKFMEAPVASNP